MAGWPAMLSSKGSSGTCIPEVVVDIPTLRFAAQPSPGEAAPLLARGGQGSSSSLSAAKAFSVSQ
jgi:hypothetical protein